MGQCSCLLKEHTFSKTIAFAITSVSVIRYWDISPGEPCLKRTSPRSVPTASYRCGKMPSQRNIYGKQRVKYPTAKNSSALFMKLLMDVKHFNSKFFVKICCKKSSGIVLKVILLHSVFFTDRNYMF